jgi:predicted short-subunit dehydrogenase-like oxidoreductase (DUF2520 family)
LARAWAAAGHEIGAVSTRGGAAAAAIGVGVDGGDLSEADVVVFATPDTALPSVAAEHTLRSEQVALHLSGALPSTVLAPTGARTAGLHPLRAFADLETSLAALPGTWCFVEGDAVEVAEQLARDLGGRSVRIDTAGKVKYHAAAAIASNFTVTLLGWARELFVDAGVGEEDALAALSALAAGAVENVARVRLPHALTGPAARGDVEIIRGHLEALDAEQRELYRRLLRATLPIARAQP